VQTVLMNILEVLVRVLAPILSFTCDEVWEHFPPALRGGQDRPASVQLAGWPARSDFAPALPTDDGAADLARFERAMEVRDVVTKALEEARTEKRVNKSQEACVKVTVPAAALDELAGYAPEVFEELFIVSGVSLQAGEEFACEVEPAQGEKCPRCWNYRSLGGNAAHPDVCGRCGDALEAIGFSA
jgi:isoleucyl-tRNA synthetase